MDSRITTFSVKGFQGRGDEFVHLFQDCGPELQGDVLVESLVLDRPSIGLVRVSRDEICLICQNRWFIEAQEGLPERQIASISATV